jgi:hypothetical protein
LSDFHRAHAEQLLAPLCDIPPHARHQVRRGVRFEGASIIFFESRPAFRSPHQWRDHPIAKFRWVKNRRRWQLFCVWRDLKWHRYDHLPESRDLAALVAEVRADPTGIFFG